MNNNGDHATKPEVRSPHSFVTVRARGLLSAHALSHTLGLLPSDTDDVLHVSFTRTDDFRRSAGCWFYKRFGWTRVENKKRWFLGSLNKEKGKTSTSRFLHFGVGESRWDAAAPPRAHTKRKLRDRSRAALLSLLRLIGYLNSATTWATTLQPISELCVKPRPLCLTVKR